MNDWKPVLLTIGMMIGTFIVSFLVTLALS